MVANLAIDLGIARVRECRHGVMMFLPHDAYVGRSLDLYGEFSEEEIALAAQVLKPGAVAIDIGANIGALTIPLARLVGREGSVIAVEPQPFVSYLLGANVAMNGLENVRVENCALGRSAGVARIPRVAYGQAANFGAVSAKSEAGSSGGPGTVPVPLRMLDDLMLARCDFIKVDVEGNELDVLLGAKATLAKHRSIVYIENDRDQNSRALLDHLIGLDYKLFWHTPYLFSPGNFRGRGENVFPGTMSINVVGVARERAGPIEGLEPVTGAADTWRAALSRQAQRRGRSG